jgi:hypothetical protein
MNITICYNDPLIVILKLISQSEENVDRFYMRFESNSLQQRRSLSEIPHLLKEGRILRYRGKLLCFGQ